MTENLHNILQVTIYTYITIIYTYIHNTTYYLRAKLMKNCQNVKST